MGYHGDWQAGNTAIYWLFNTTVNGVPTSLAGSPAVEVYKNSLTQRAEASALTVDYDGVVGLNQILIDTSSSSSFYAADNFFDVKFSAGTLGGVTLVGRTAGSFSLSTRSTNLDKTVTGMGRGVVTTGASTTSIPTSAFTMGKGASLTAVTDQFKSAVVMFDPDTATAGLRGAQATISGSTSGTTPTFTVAALPATPASGDTFSIV